MSSQYWLQFDIRFSMGPYPPGVVPPPPPDSYGPWAYSTTSGGQAYYVEPVNAVPYPPPPSSRSNPPVERDTSGHADSSRAAQSRYHSRSRRDDRYTPRGEDSVIQPVIPERVSRGSRRRDCDDSDEPIKFYQWDAPYYEFTNFAQIPMYYMGREYTTAEHLFQALKFIDHQPQIAEQIRKMPSAREARDEAARMKAFQRRDWFVVNVRVMDNVLRLKFEQHENLRRKLIETGDRDLIEDSPTDAFWGNGHDGRGRNELGKALMRLRADLQGHRRRHNL